MCLAGGPVVAFSPAGVARMQCFKCFEKLNQVTGSNDSTLRKAKFLLVTDKNKLTSCMRCGNIQILKWSRIIIIYTLHRQAQM